MNSSSGHILSYNPQELHLVYIFQCNKDGLSLLFNIFTATDTSVSFCILAQYKVTLMQMAILTMLPT